MSAIHPYRIFREDFREMEQFLKEQEESMFNNKKFTYEQVEEAKQRAVADAAELFMKSVSGHCADIQKSIKKYEAEIEALRAEVRVLRRNSSTAEMEKAILRPGQPHETQTGVHGMKLIIAMRKDLNMRKGKMVAQGAHAACMPFIAECDDDQARIQQLEKWVESGMTKVCVGVESEQELDQLVTQAIHAKVPVFTVRDAGRTEIAAGTVTCAAFGPATAEELGPITGKLVLL